MCCMCAYFFCSRIKAKLTFFKKKKKLSIDGKLLSFFLIMVFSRTDAFKLTKVSLVHGYTDNYKQYYRLFLK